MCHLPDLGCFAEARTVRSAGWDQPQAPRVAASARSCVAAQRGAVDWSKAPINIDTRVERVTDQRRSAPAHSCGRTPAPAAAQRCRLWLTGGRAGLPACVRLCADLRRSVVAAFQQECRHAIWGVPHRQVADALEHDAAHLRRQPRGLGDEPVAFTPHERDRHANLLQFREAPRTHRRVDGLESRRGQGMRAAASLPPPAVHDLDRRPCRRARPAVRRRSWRAPEAAARRSARDAARARAWARAARATAMRARSRSLNAPGRRRRARARPSRPASCRRRGSP